MVRLSMHFIFFALILFGFYYVTVYPPLVSMEVFALGQIHIFTGQEVYLMLVGNLLVMYLFVMLLNFTGSISLWASRYTKAHKNNMADRLIRQAIESWVEGKPERAGRKFAKASDILPDDPLRELCAAWLLASCNQLQLADAKVLELLNKKAISTEVAAGIRARIYMERSQPVVAAAILHQQIQQCPTRGLMMLYCRLLDEFPQQLRHEYLKDVSLLIGSWRLVKDNLTFKKVLKRATEIAIIEKSSDLWALWPYIKSVLEREDYLYMQYLRKRNLDNQLEEAVDFLLSHLQNNCVKSLYSLLGQEDYRIQDQISAANRWLSYVEKDMSTKVMTRLYLREGSIQQGVEYARAYLALEKKVSHST